MLFVNSDPRDWFFEYESVEVCVAVNKTREVFEISAFGGNRLYRIIYANILYFVVIHGGPLLLIAFFNVKLIQALKHRQRRRAEMGKSWYQQDVSVVLIVVMCVFIVCQTPTFVDHILSAFQRLNLCASPSPPLRSIEIFSQLFRNAEKSGVICRPHPE